MTHKEKLEQLQSLLNQRTRNTDASTVTSSTQATINQLLFDLLQEEVVEMKQIGFLAWVQKNPSMALLLVVLLGFGSGVTVSDIVMSTLGLVGIG